MVIGVGDKRLPGLENFGTHNGVFHCDGVVGIAILDLANAFASSYVVRTRDPEELSKLDVVIDVGGGALDHHMAGFNKRRPTGEKYASAGLVWEQYGETVIRNILWELNVSIPDEEVAFIKEQIDRELIIPVDLEDNGESFSNHTFSFITKFLPSWIEKPNYNSAFSRVEQVVSSILKETIKDAIVNIVTRFELQARFECAEDGILEIPEQTMPWLKYVLEYNESHAEKINFVIFHYPAGGWAAQCVPPSLERKFEQLVPFPREWAGENETTLPSISGITDAVFCHNGRFFARAKSKESIIKMCNFAKSKK